MTEAIFDSMTRERVANLPVPELEGQPFVVPKPLSECTVAIVTSAGLHAPDDDNFVSYDQSYREITEPIGTLIMSQGSQNFDRSGYMQDRNVVFPIDRLRELADQGVIGAVAGKHYAFNGALPELSTILKDSGPACAKQLLEDGTDVVILTPV